MLFLPHHYTEEDPLRVLSRLERKILAMYLKGMSYTQIAKRLSRGRKLPVNTTTQAVDNALCRIMRKTGAMCLRDDP